MLTRRERKQIQREITFERNCFYRLDAVTAKKWENGIDSLVEKYSLAEYLLETGNHSRVRLNRLYEVQSAGVVVFQYKGPNTNHRVNIKGKSGYPWSIFRADCKKLVKGEWI